MQSPVGLVLYFLFVLVLVGAYLGIRRQWAPPAAIAAVCVVASFIIILLISLTQGNSIYQAIFAGLLVGGLFSGGILGMAWYFHRNEHAKATMSEDFQPETPEE
jgi:Na+/H+-translocating membrane pyrophosphatase